MFSPSLPPAVGCSTARCRLYPLHSLAFSLLCQLLTVGDHLCPLVLAATFYPGFMYLNISAGDNSKCHTPEKNYVIQHMSPSVYPFTYSAEIIIDGYTLSSWYGTCEYSRVCCVLRSYRSRHTL